MKAFYLYILKCADGSYYTGHTDNIENRVEEHYCGKGETYTAKRLPVQLVFVEEFASRYEAISAEQQIKKWTRKKKEILATHGWEAMQHFKSRWKSKK